MILLLHYNGFQVIQRQSNYIRNELQFQVFNIINSIVYLRENR